MTSQTWGESSAKSSTKNPERSPDPLPARQLAKVNENFFIRIFVNNFDFAFSPSFPPVTADRRITSRRKSSKFRQSGRLARQGTPTPWKHFTQNENAATRGFVVLRPES